MFYNIERALLDAIHPGWGTIIAPSGVSASIRARAANIANKPVPVPISNTRWPVEKSRNIALPQAWIAYKVKSICWWCIYWWPFSVQSCKVQEGRIFSCIRSNNLFPMPVNFHIFLQTEVIHSLGCPGGWIVCLCSHAESEYDSGG